MKLVENNYEYIHATATAKAVEIARATGMFAEVEDFRQDLIMALVVQAGSYNPDRATQRTFISVCINNARKDLLKKLFRDKRKANMCGVEINEEKHEAQQSECRLMPEEMNKLPERLQRICQDILHGMSITETARNQGITKRDVRQAIFNEVPECLEDANEKQKVLQDQKKAGSGGGGTHLPRHTFFLNDVSLKNTNNSTGKS